TGQWWRSYGNELWEFDDGGLMRRREASINDVAIDESDRRYFGRGRRRTRPRLRPALTTIRRRAEAE
ncbi:nuclear transport factor 2 family protein, partial [Mycolicibacterium vanbaalenii]|uniref:nuclear transport factor 2 family protein n=1 Tax=Mycolicibacterium vanbaalenii TaxID=110539 RepID=UPI0021F320BD